MQIEISKIQELLDWLKTKIYLDANVNQANKRYVKRGQVYNCHFGIGIGNEIQKLRPCVILQNNIGNAKSGNVLVAPITHTYKDLPAIRKITSQQDENGTIILDGYVNLSNIVCVSKARLENYITTLSISDIKEIDIGLAISLDLMKYYAKSQKSLNDKLTYIEKIKNERNIAQDELANLLEISNCSSLDDLKKLLNSIDKHKK